MSAQNGVSTRLQTLSWPSRAFIFFTGSTRTDKVVARTAAEENLTPVILECGGTNPALVDETSEFAAAGSRTAGPNA